MIASVPRALVCGVATSLSLLVAAAALAQVPVGGLVELYSAPEDTINLVKNSSFEAVDANGRILDWQVTPAGSFRSTADESHEGSRSLILQDGNLARYYPSATQTLQLRSGWYTLTGWMKAHDAGQNDPNAGGRISVKWGTGAASSPVVRGSTDWTKVEVRFFLKPGESASIRLEAYRKPDGAVFFDDLQLHRQSSPLVEGFLLYPNYRGLLFDDRSQVVSVSGAVRPEEAGLTMGDLVVRTLIETDAGLPVASQDLVPDAPTFTVSLDASPAPLGSLRLRVQALRAATGQVIFEYPSYRIVKVPASARDHLAAYVDPDNVLVLNGKRTFVLGIYDTGGYSSSPARYERKISRIAEAPFNLYLNYWLGKAHVKALNALMFTLQKHGMAYLHTVNSWYTDNPHYPWFTPCGRRTADRLGEDRFTACMAAVARPNPGLAGWYTADEQPASQVERVFHQYTLLRQGDPGGVTFIAQNNPRELTRWRDAADVIGVDPYPIYNIPEGSPSPLEMVANWVDSAEAAVEGSRPVWAVIQFFQFGSHGHWATYDELRTMSYLAIVGGAKGLFYWSYGAKGLAWVSDPALREQYWRRLVRVTTEIKSLEPALISPDAPGILTGFSPGGSIRLLPKQVSGTRYLIAVNDTAQAVDATFALASSADRAQVVGEGRTVAVSGTTFADKFGPYQTHVYQITGGVTP